MAVEHPFSDLTLAHLAERCTEESNRFFAQRAHDPRFCFELFRRALVEGSEMAWRLLIAQYRPLVSSWVERQPAFPLSGEETDYFVNGAFVRLLKAVGAHNFSRFDNLRSLLGYLQLCVSSEIQDHVRGLKDKDTVSLEEYDFTAAVAEVDVEERAAELHERNDLWETVRACANDEAEFLVIYGSYVLGLKPRQLLDKYPDKYESVQRIYRIKENVLARLRRDPQMASFSDEVA